MSTPKDPSRDLVIERGMPGYYTDPIMLKDGTVAKVGYDCTMLPEQRTDFEFRRVAGFHVSTAPARHQTVRQALEAGPLFLRRAGWVRSAARIGREVALALDALRDEGILTRLKEGQWTLKNPDQK